MYIVAVYFGELMVPLKVDMAIQKRSSFQMNHKTKTYSK